MVEKLSTSVHVASFPGVQTARCMPLIPGIVIKLWNNSTSAYLISFEDGKMNDSLHLTNDLRGLNVGAH
jgi:hypothetical protein